jgi:hypothetical protein
MSCDDIQCIDSESAADSQIDVDHPSASVLSQQQSILSYFSSSRSSSSSLSALSGSSSSLSSSSFSSSNSSSVFDANQLPGTAAIQGLKYIDPWVNHIARYTAECWKAGLFLRSLSKRPGVDKFHVVCRLCKWSNDLEGSNPLEFHAFHSHASVPSVKQWKSNKEEKNDVKQEEKKACDNALIVVCFPLPFSLVLCLPPQILTARLL